MLGAVPAVSPALGACPGAAASFKSAGLASTGKPPAMICDPANGGRTNAFVRTSPGTAKASAPACRRKKSPTPGGKIAPSWLAAPVAVLRHCGTSPLRM